MPKPQVFTDVENLSIHASEVDTSITTINVKDTSQDQDLNNIKTSLTTVTNDVNAINKMITDGTIGGTSEPAKVFTEIITVKGLKTSLTNKYRYNNSMKAIITGITLFIPDADIIDNGMTVKLDSIGDVISDGDQIVLNWFDKTPMGKKVRQLNVPYPAGGLINFSGFSYEPSKGYSSVYIDGFRLFPGIDEFSYAETNSTSIQINGDFTGSTVNIELLID